MKNRIQRLAEVGEGKHLDSSAIGYADDTSLYCGCIAVAVAAVVVLEALARRTALAAGGYRSLPRLANFYRHLPRLAVFKPHRFQSAFISANAI